MMRTIEKKRARKRVALWSIGWVLAVIAASDASQYTEKIDSSVGKSPYFVLASAAGGIPAINGWERGLAPVSVGKAPFVIFDGSPPRGSIPSAIRFDSARFFYVYADHNSAVNHFLPVGPMGDREDIQLEDTGTENPADGSTCIRVHYRALSSEGRGWAGLYWLDPRSNWGQTTAGFNLTGMARLTFWARGEAGGEQIAVFKVGGIQGAHPDTGSAEIGPIVLSREWRHYSIDLRGADLSKISGGFAAVVSGADNGHGVTFFVDEIRYER